MAAFDRRLLLIQNQKLVLLLILLERRKKRDSQVLIKRRKRFCVRKIFQERRLKGLFNVLVKDLGVRENIYFYILNINYY